MIGPQYRIPSSSWITNTFCLPDQCWKLHAWSLCFHCPLLLPLLYSTLYSKYTELLSVPRKLHGLSPFLVFARAIPPACNTVHTSLSMTPTAPPPYLAHSCLSFRCHLRGHFIQEAFFTIPLHCKLRWDLLPICYFKHLLFLSHL